VQRGRQPRPFALRLGERRRLGMWLRAVARPACGGPARRGDGSRRLGRRDASAARRLDDARELAQRLVDRPDLLLGEPWRVVLTRSGKLPRRARLFSDRLAARTLIYEGKSLAGVLENLGKLGITSVLIEGGGDVLGQALDARLIDKVQLYLGPILTGGPVIAFPGRGADNAASAVRLRRVSYQRIAQSVCITGYPERPTSK